MTRAANVLGQLVELRDARRRLAFVWGATRAQGRAGRVVDLAARRRARALVEAELAACWACVARIIRSSGQRGRP